MDNAYEQTGTIKPYPEEQKIGEILRQLGKLLPEFYNTRQLEGEVLLPLRTLDFYTRRQALMIWDIYRTILHQITETALQASNRYLQMYNEDDVMDFWASSLDRTLTELYRVFTMSSIESFLERFGNCHGRTFHGTA